MNVSHILSELGSSICIHDFSYSLRFRYARAVLGWVQVNPSEILYVDDLTLHIEHVRDSVGAVHFVQIWVNAKSPDDILEYINRA